MAPGQGGHRGTLSRPGAVRPHPGEPHRGAPARGRLTFTRGMAAAIFHVIDAKAPYGTYNCTGSGAVRSLADIARAVFEAANGNGGKVAPVSTADYYAGAAGPVAPRPVHSALDLSKLESAGFHMPDWDEELVEYLKML